MGFFVVASMGSNRTFMELKYLNKFRDAALDSSSNRTFMELKYHLMAGSDNCSKVLIVPLWN